MKPKLSSRLLLFLAFGLFCIFLGQTTTHIVFELPVLYDLERLGDQKDIERVRSTYLDDINNLESVVVSYGAWDGTYKAMENKGKDQSFKDYISSYYTPSTFKSLKFNGVVYLNTDGEVIYQSAFDLDAEYFSDSLRLDLESLDKKILEQKINANPIPVVNSGLTRSNLGPLMFAASKIVTTEAPYPDSRGTIIFWRLMDDLYFAALSQSLHTDIKYYAANKIQDGDILSEKLNLLGLDEHSFLARDSEENLFWLISDVSEQPAILIQQKAEQREFNSSWFSPSVIVGFGISALVLVMLSIFISRIIIDRITKAKSIMTDIVNTGKYNKRLEQEGSDEIDLMYQQFNQLLDYIEVQDQELKDKNKELEELSQLDALTGIPNRRYLDEALDRCWRLCARNKQDLAVLMIDIDNFKLFNDHYGHQAGDETIQHVARVLDENLHRATDHLARYGGEEFCVILTETKLQNAILVGERLRQAVEALQLSNEVSTCSSVVTISVGIAGNRPTKDLVVMNLVKAADDALYHAKEQGRNRVYAQDYEQQ